MSDVRERFAEKFGEDQAAAIEAAAETHGDGINNKKIGEYFKWACLIAIGYQCFEVDSYREHHKITAPFEDIKAWLREHGELGTYCGDVDYLAFFAGQYDEYLTKEEVEK